MRRTVDFRKKNTSWIWDIWIYWAVRIDIRTMRYSKTMEISRGPNKPGWDGCAWRGRLLPYPPFKLRVDPLKPSCLMTGHQLGPVLVVKIGSATR